MSLLEKADENKNVAYECLTRKKYFNVGIICSYHSVLQRCIEVQKNEKAEKGFAEEGHHIIILKNACYAIYRTDFVNNKRLSYALNTLRERRNQALYELKLMNESQLVDSLKIVDQFLKELDQYYERKRSNFN